jgi:anti-sigma factor RsiW
MKESRFVELLNLYVDHELAQGEAAELDAELQRNPARRETLREYRALQRGCERLLEADRALAPRTAEAVRTLRGLRSDDARPDRSRWAGWTWVAGTGAAAGLAVMVTMSLDRSVPSDTPQASASVASAATSTPATVARGGDASALEMWDVTVPAPAEPRGLRMRSLWIPVSGEREAGSALVAVASADLSWLDEVRLPAVRAPRPEELRFGERATSVHAVEQLSPSRRPLGATLEMTAFQFQR